MNKLTAYQVTKRALAVATDAQVRKALQYLKAGNVIYSGRKTEAYGQFVSNDGKFG